MVNIGLRLKISRRIRANAIKPLIFPLALVSCQNTCLEPSQHRQPAVAATEQSLRDTLPQSANSTRPKLQSEGARVESRSGKCPAWSDLLVQDLLPLPNTAYTQTFEHLWSVVLRKHYDPTLNCLDWPKLRLHYGAQLEGAQDRAHAYRIYNELLAQLGQSHLRAIPPQGNRAAPQNHDSETGPARVPIQMRWIDEQWIVVRSRYGDADPIPAGSIVVSIGDKSPAEILNETIDQAKGRRNGQNSDRSKVLSFEERGRVDSLLHCPEGGSKKVAFLDPHVNDSPRNRILNCILPAGERASLGNLRNLPTRITWRMIKETSVGYLAFNYWMMTMVPKIENAIAQLRDQGMTALLIDLRGNPGGIAPMVIPVARLLLKQDGDLGQLSMREFTQEFKVNLGRDPFTGPVDILIDESSASTSEIFSLGMRDLGRVHLVGGSASAGMALPSLIENLPDGGLFQYVVGNYKSSRGNVAEGGGVKPDILVDENRRDFVASRDSVLEAGVDHVQRVQR